jgi:hypothetical protein
VITLTKQDVDWLAENLHVIDANEATKRRIVHLFSHGSDLPADPERITDRCTCNQPDDARDHGHQRGDTALCRDTIDSAASAASEDASKSGTPCEQEAEQCA